MSKIDTKCGNDASCTEIIMALGPLTKLDVAAGNNALALLLATIGAGGAGTSEDSVIDVDGMLYISTHGFFV